jgi:hypothetical protein
MIPARSDAIRRTLLMRVVTEDKMAIEKVEVERFSLTSSKPFDAVVAALKSAVGQPDMVEFFKETRATNSFPDLERVVQRGLGRTDLMLFAEFDDAGSYAPVTVLVDERPDGVHVSYDKMESYLLRYGSSEALAVARTLDAKITTLLRECAS